MTLSTVILTKNEERNIAECIQSTPIGEEILVVDDFSTDKTIEIATQLGARVIQHALKGDWAQQRNFALTQAQGDWVFFLDADERMTNDLREVLGRIGPNTTLGAYKVRRVNRFSNHILKHGAMRPDYVVRLVPKMSGRFSGSVHERVSSPEVVGKLPGDITHCPYRDWEHHTRKSQHYSTLAAQSYFAEGKRCVWLRDIWLRPLWAFFKVYILNLGFLDGALGWQFSIKHALYTRDKYRKLYQLQMESAA